MHSLSRAARRVGLPCAWAGLPPALLCLCSVQDAPSRRPVLCIEAHPSRHRPDPSVRYASNLLEKRENDKSKNESEGWPPGGGVED